IYGVTFLFQRLELFADRVDVLRVLHFANTVLNDAPGARKNLGQHAGSGTRFLNPEDLRSPRSSINQVDDLVQLGSEGVNILAVEWRDESAINTIDDVVGDVVSFVL